MRLHMFVNFASSATLKYLHDMCLQVGRDSNALILIVKHMRHRDIQGQHIPVVQSFPNLMVNLNRSVTHYCFRVDMGCEDFHQIVIFPSQAV